MALFAWLAVLTQYQRVTDRHMMTAYHASIVLCGKHQNVKYYYQHLCSCVNYYSNEMLFSVQAALLGQHSVQLVGMCRESGVGLF